MTFPERARGPGTDAVGRPRELSRRVPARCTTTTDIVVGYRYYDRVARTPLFPFGYGLSYTSFSFDRLQVRRQRDGRYDVSVRVRNTGTRVGAAVLQLYLGFPSSTEPPNQLKGFRQGREAPAREAHQDDAESVDLPAPGAPRHAPGPWSRGTYAVRRHDRQHRAAAQARVVIR